MNLPADKTALRKDVLAQRARVSPGVRQSFAQRLAEIGPDLVHRHAGGGSTVSVYHPIRDEADTVPLFQALTQAGIATALPVTVARGHALRFLLWRSGDPVAPGNWGIPEPLSTAPSVDPDLLFVPLAAFDRRGFRLGYGAGFYDNTLAALRTRKPVLAIGVAFSVQEVASVPTEPHDQPLDAIITETDVMFCGRG